jgi:hypothetical protein
VDHRAVPAIKAIKDLPETRARVYRGIKVVLDQLARKGIQVKAYKAAKVDGEAIVVHPIV